MTSEQPENEDHQSNVGALLVVVGRKQRHDKIKELLGDFADAEWVELCERLAQNGEVHSLLPSKRCVILPDFEAENAKDSLTIQNCVRRLFEEHSEHCQSAALIVLNCFPEGGEVHNELHRAFAVHLTLRRLQGKALILNISDFS